MNSLGPPPPNCDECKDVRAALFCVNCKDHFCDPCFFYIHKSGKRAEHNVQQVLGHTIDAHEKELGAHNNTTAAGATASFQEPSKLNVTAGNNFDPKTRLPLANPVHLSQPNIYAALKQGSASVFFGDDKACRHAISNFADFIPMRLDAHERILLEICEGALKISEYTDNVDISSAYGGGYGSFMSMGSRFGLSADKKEKLIEKEVEELIRICLGLYVSCDLKAVSKQGLFDSLGARIAFFGQLAEVGRRNKILNPNSMRETYGKLICVLQDTRYLYPADQVVLPIKTVGEHLRKTHALQILNDPVFLDACKLKLSKHHTQFESEQRERRKTLQATYGDILKPDEIDLIIDSCRDYNAHKLHNMSCVERMISKLDTVLNTKEVSLAIMAGTGGSELTHTHKQQATFVKQSLQLWLEIQADLNRLWICTDADLLSSRYRLMNTGQGLQRVQSAPKIASAMSEILQITKGKAQDAWVGLSVVHLGDRDVPNGLFFIDKYNQIVQILSPIVQCTSRLSELIPIMDPATFDSNRTEISILADYFKHGFDGSGDDGGSCIDGRLTSSWNWCSKIEEKLYFFHFLLTDFVGFNGDFRQK